MEPVVKLLVVGTIRYIEWLIPTDRVQPSLIAGVMCAGYMVHPAVFHNDTGTRITTLYSVSECLTGNVSEPCCAGAIDATVQCMYLSRVLVGHTTVGERASERLPCRYTRCVLSSLSYGSMSGNVMAMCVCVYSQPTPCEIHTVYLWRIVQGWIGVCRAERLCSQPTL